MVYSYALFLASYLSLPAPHPMIQTQAQLDELRELLVKQDVIAEQIRPVLTDLLAERVATAPQDVAKALAPTLSHSITHNQHTPDLRQTLVDSLTPLVESSLHKIDPEEIIDLIEPALQHFVNQAVAQAKTELATELERQLSTRLETHLQSSLTTAMIQVEQDLTARLTPTLNQTINNKMDDLQDDMQNDLKIYPMLGGIIVVLLLIILGIVILG